MKVLGVSLNIQTDDPMAMGASLYAALSSVIENVLNMFPEGKARAAVQASLLGGYTGAMAADIGPEQVASLLESLANQLREIANSTPPRTH